MKKLCRSRAKGILFVMLVLGGTMLTGCLDFTGKLAAEREDLQKRRKILRDNYKKVATKLDHRDRNKQELIMTELRLDLFRRAQKMMQEGKNE
ncbi:MAG: hypothetical protein CVV41_19810 [Candidatus Riflebacteria bacterium HGW-Riflebacteria-1]|jgi:hypothetical protein|nr:MAG: hypothetical protein CVV41_19810 [Candidatus Riflebacteria bacterium HGW-Riflebacteria-1]